MGRGCSRESGSVAGGKPQKICVAGSTISLNKNFLLVRVAVSKVCHAVVDEIKRWEDEEVRLILPGWTRRPDQVA
jgi:hypothetical protein